MSHKIALAAALAASLIPAFLVAVPAVAQQAETTIINPDSLKWNPIAFPGITIAVGEGKAVALKPGSVVVIPADAAHYGWTTDGEALLQEVGTAPTGIKIWPKAAG